MNKSDLDGMVTHSRRILWISCDNHQQCEVFILSNLYFPCNAYIISFCFQIVQDLLLVVVSFGRWRINLLIFSWHVSVLVLQHTADSYIVRIIEEMKPSFFPTFFFCLLILYGRLVELPANLFFYDLILAPFLKAALLRTKCHFNQIDFWVFMKTLNITSRFRII